MNDGTAIAPEGQIWVCLACGKTSKSRYGFDENNKRVAMRGWDESCMLNSQLVSESLIETDEHGIVVRIKELENESL